MASLSTTDESDDDEFMLVHGREQLPDTVLLTLPKHLSEKDCLALVLSGASRRFTDLFTTNRINHKSSLLIFYILSTTGKGLASASVSIFYPSHGAISSV